MISLNLQHTNRHDGQPALSCSASSSLLLFLSFFLAVLHIHSLTFSFSLSISHPPYLAFCTSSLYILFLSPPPPFLSLSVVSDGCQQAGFSLRHNLAKQTPHDEIRPAPLFLCRTFCMRLCGLSLYPYGQRTDIQTSPHTQSRAMATSVSWLIGPLIRQLRASCDLPEREAEPTLTIHLCHLTV